MQKCPKCLAEQDNVNSHSCFYCGADMSNSDYHTNDEIQADKDDYIPEQSISLPDSDELGIETNADIMETEAHNLEETSPTDKIETSNNDFTKENKKTESDEESSKLKKLSDNEIKEIENNLYKSDNFINDRDKSDLIEKISSINISQPEPFSNKPIDPKKTEPVQKTPKSDIKPEAELPIPQIAKKGQGLAFFYKNYIQIQGSQKLHPDDEMNINNRNYILKPKNLNKNFILYSAAASVIIVILIIGSFLAGNSSVGNGQVFGIILDENNRPFIEGATVVFTELDKKINSDAQGLFSFSNIPAGSHKIEYLIGNKITGSDYITIAQDNNSYITLKPSPQISENKIDPLKQLAMTSANKQPEIKTKPKEKLTTPKSTKKTVKKTSKKKKNNSKSKTTKSKKLTSGYGKLVLDANVEGAKIKVDGNVLGAGNLTYSKIKSGKHSYTVSLDGYETVSGTFSVKKGKTKKISPILKPLTQAKKEETFKNSDYFYSAQNAYKQGNYKAAITDYKKVIDETPNNVKAYYGLAESYSKLKEWNLAYENYIRSAEIYRFKGKINDAVTCYNNAIDVNSKESNAYLGRGTIYLDAGEYRAALIDFDKVVKLDRRNFKGYYGMGEASFKLQRYTQAVKYFKDARSLDKTNPLIHQYLTLSYMYEHDRKNTKKSFEKFNKYASENDKVRFKKDSQYSAVIKYMDSE